MAEYKCELCNITFGEAGALALHNYKKHNLVKGTSLKYQKKKVVEEDLTLRLVLKYIREAKSEISLNYAVKAYKKLEDAESALGNYLEKQ